MITNERWYKSGPYGTGINRHYTITAKTDHSDGPTFAQIDVAHSTEEALKTADERATIIAAAPDLLEALNRIANLLEKSEPRPTHPATGELMGRRPKAQQMIDIARAAIAKAEVKS